MDYNNLQLDGTCDEVMPPVDLGAKFRAFGFDVYEINGSAVAEVVAESGKGVLRRVGIQDQFGQSAPYEWLLAINGVTVEHIVELAKELNA